MTMTKDDIIRMAREAGLHRQQHNLMSNPVQYRYSYDGYEENLEAFAALVAAAEREACAKVCEDIFNDPKGNNGDDYYYTRPYLECADAIRERGNP
jgi:effector-binding domain-containing protein